ncbi:hypothetical protein [Clostridium sp. ZS2-4]|uniref:hypothetical protein n=1 Tax=Clostridium sp. ZS2-4 TaxID=2987703 RepID=UPI00227C3FF8|nr:hypothetical protein [Clostridium sp. ZS2-4]MCY6354388.1 hypothetical protein [Clostridium sp. ZS2-4]
MNDKTKLLIVIFLIILYVILDIVYKKTSLVWVNHLKFIVVLLEGVMAIYNLYKYKQ